MTIKSMLDEGVHLIQTQPKIVAVWAAINMVVVTLIALAMQPFQAAMIAAQQQAAANAASGIKTAPRLPPGQLGYTAILDLILFGLVIVGFAAVVRAVVRPTGDRFAYLRVGMDELRLLGLGVLLALMMLLGEIVAIIAVGLPVALAFGIAGRNIGILVAVILGVAAFGAIIYGQVRISLAGALTVMRRRIVIKEAWQITKGHFWTLFGAYVLMAAAYFIISILVAGFTHPELSTIFAQHTPQAMQAAVLSLNAPQTFSVMGIIGLITSAVIMLVMAVFIFAGITRAAIEMGGMDSGIADEF